MGGGDFEGEGRMGGDMSAAGGGGGDRRGEVLVEDSHPHLGDGDIRGALRKGEKR